jgi:hypothetical protein
MWEEIYKSFCQKISSIRTRNRNLLVQNVIYVCCLWWPLNSHRRKSQERQFKCEHCDFKLRSIEKMEKPQSLHIIWKSLQDRTLYLTDGPFEVTWLKSCWIFLWHICMRNFERFWEFWEVIMRQLLITREKEGARSRKHKQDSAKDNRKHANGR